MGAASVRESDSVSDQDSKYVVLGRIAGLYGVRGWLKVVSYTRPRENLLNYDRWWLQRDGVWHSHACRDSRVQGKTLIVALEGIEDRDRARTFIGTVIAIPRDQLPPLAAGEYYWCDLIGLTVNTKEGVRLGHIVRLEETGGHDVLVVQETGAAEQLIPYVPGIYVLEVDLGNGRVTVDWPAAALDG